MQSWKKIFQFKNLIYLFLILFFIGNLLFLTSFPYVHSDESWLSGLSRNMIVQHNISVTEPFFDAYQRNPHAIRLLFHLLQGLMMQFFGYTIFSFRLISLLFSIATLYFFYRLALITLKTSKTALLATVLLSLDLQYLYASHFARQEIIIVFVLVLSAYLLISHIDTHTYKRDLVIGTVVGLSIGIHPNSFIIAVAIGITYCYFTYKKKIHLKNLLVFIGIVFLFCLIFIGLSLYMDPSYLTHYSQHGKNFGAYDSIGNKCSDFIFFYQRIFNGDSIEYYMPNIQFQLILFSLSLILAIIYFLKGKNRLLITKLTPILIMVFGINLGLLAIGRFNVTSIVLLFPFMYLLTAMLLEYWDKKSGLLIILILLTAINSIIQIHPYKSSYHDYCTQISQFISKDDHVLGNLNSEYCFANDQFFDYRNLQYLDDQKISFSNYIATRKIKYIIYYDELDYIYTNRPKYDIMYGDLTTIYPEMKAFLKLHCTEIYQFSDSTYGINLAPLIDQKPWQIHIFKVNDI